MDDESEPPWERIDKLLGLDAEQRRRAMMATFTNMTVDMLVKKEYQGLEAWTQGRHLSAGALRHAVEDFGRPLVRIRLREEPDVSPVRLTDRATYDVSVPLWTEDGQSDLRLELRFVEFDVGEFRTEVLALHVVPAGGTPSASTAETEPLPMRAQPPERRQLPAPYEHPVPERWRQPLAEIVHRLVIKDYAGLSRDGSVGYTNDPSDESIGTWIEDYPWNLVDLPEQAWAYSDHFPLDATTWAVTLDLWTAEEGLSDLSIEATVHDDGSEITVKINGIHVM